MLSNRYEILVLVLFLSVSFICIYVMYRGIVSCIVSVCFFFFINLTFPSAIKVFYQRGHCTFSVGNS